MRLNYGWGMPGGYLAGALGFTVRTIAGEEVGDLVEIVADEKTGAAEIVISRRGLFARRIRLPAALVLGTNAAERVVILNVGTAAAVKWFRR